MLIFLIFIVVALALKLRYRMHVTGLEECVRKGTGHTLFLPNHPALVDPIIMSCLLFRKFRPHALVVEKQIRQTPLRFIQRQLGILPIPDMGVVGKVGMEKATAQINACADILQKGENILMYPAGRIYHSKTEQLRGNGGVAQIISKYPDVRIVLVRTRGLWGSSFSRAKGYQEQFTKTLLDNMKHILMNLIFFSPRRDVSVEFVEMPADFPKSGTKEEINRYLEAFYNKDLAGNTYVPYHWWERGGARIIPEPDVVSTLVDTSQVPQDVRTAVYAKIREMSPKKDLTDSNTLGTDLGMDSLMVAELHAWIQSEFGFQAGSPENLHTVANVLLAAIGQSASAEPLRPIPPNWFVKADSTLLRPPENCPKITDTFLTLAKRDPNFALVADQSSGVITNRKAVLAIMVLKPYIEKIQGERVGILMPACAPAFIVYMATLFAGKTPVMVNWTVGARNLEYCMKNADVTSILTSKLLIERLEGRGTDFSTAKGSFIYLEDMKKEISLFHKLRCLVASRFSWRSLRKAKVSEHVAILFTSGSESMPKTVPLTHNNVISDIRSAMDAMGLRKDDCMEGMLPPFHSFGLLINFLMPAVANLRVTYHPNPTEGDMLARLIAAYHVTMIVGTPTFAAAILRNATKEQMQSVRILITGAEKCPDATYKMFFEKCPGAFFLEGYGITECSPVVALNRPATAIPGTVGTMLDCLDFMICDEKMNKLPVGQTGMLYLSGPSIFEGYLNYNGPSPFVEMDGKRWYRTGDLVKADKNNIVTFMGRLKRFVKIGGEMVSLPAIEEVLTDLYRTDKVPIPLAVEAFGTDAMPEIVLFTVLDLDKDNVNLQIREAGMSPIHNIRRIVKLPEIPLLGSGKTDYQTIKKLGKA